MTPDTSREQRKYGRRPPKNAPAIRLADILTGTTPRHPITADYLSKLDWSATMNGNDKYGDCVAVAIGNIRKVITAILGTKPYQPTEADCIAFYKTQNPDFPKQDDGMDEQTALETMVKDGANYYDGVAPLAFAKVNVGSESELDAATAIFGPALLGVNVTDANQEEFPGTWTYIASSPVDGGHAVVEGGYNETKKTGLIETWAAVINYTDTFRQHQVEEYWVVIWPEHLGTKAFEEGVDQAALASAYTALTGKPFPVQPNPNPEPTPTPTPGPAPTPPPVADPADQALNTAIGEWQAAKGFSAGTTNPAASTRVDI